MQTAGDIQTRTNEHFQHGTLHLEAATFNLHLWVEEDENEESWEQIKFKSGRNISMQISVTICIFHVLQAELSILEGKTTKAEESFKTKTAISASRSRSNGFLQDRALVHELCSTFLQSSR